MPWDWAILHFTTESLEPELYSKYKWSIKQASKQAINQAVVINYMCGLMFQITKILVVSKYNILPLCWHALITSSGEQKPKHHHTLISWKDICIKILKYMGLFY